MTKLKKLIVTGLSICNYVYILILYILLRVYTWQLCEDNEYPNTVIFLMIREFFNMLQVIDMQKFNIIKHA